MKIEGRDRALNQALVASERAAEACQEASRALRGLLHARIAGARPEDANLLDALGGGATVASLAQSTLELTVDTLRLERGAPKLELLTGGGGRGLEEPPAPVVALDQRR